MIVVSFATVAVGAALLQFLVSFGSFYQCCGGCWLVEFAIL